jgi:REP element-mobilizing transposase RayT
MSFWRTYYHLVWGTHNREPWITEALEPKLFSYLTAKAQELGIFIYAINGWHDHIHLVASIPPKISVAEAVKKLKGASSFYINHVIQPGFEFKWQRGYGVFTLGETQRTIAEAYVENQKQHHSQQTTNGWLEKTAEFDEGPEQTKPKETAVHEQQPTYTIPYPF